MEIALAVAELVAVLVIVLTGCFIGLFAFMAYERELTREDQR